MGDEAENKYERLRQENIQKNKALLQQLQLDVPSLAVRKKDASTSKSASKTRRKPAKEPDIPVVRRTSSRLAGLPADSKVAKRKAETEASALEEVERAKKTRVAGDLSFDLKQGLVGVTQGARFGRTFTDEDVEETSDKDLKQLREKLMGLKLYERFKPNDIKICPERIYHLAFHPTVNKQLIFAGDKAGTLGIFDAQSQREGDDGEEPDVSHYKVHSRTISTFTFDLTSATSLYTSSYDGSIRKFDLGTGIASEIYVPEGEPLLSGVEIFDANIIYFSTVDGQLGRRDLRAKKAEVWTIGDKKIGGFSLHPRAPHLAATASNDRTVKLWDLRKITGTGDERMPTLIGEHASRLSVSCALWNSQGTLVTTSYDDSIKLYKFPDASKWGVGKELSEKEMKPTKVIPHNNQTGRWVTILRAQWQQNPAGTQKFVIANMNRFFDIFTDNGDQLAQLSDDSITAVPAVAQFHPSQDWVAGGTGSGKLALFM